MDRELFLEMLRVDSTSGTEGGFAEFLAGRLGTPECRVEKFEVGDGTVNLLFSWGEPKVVFCSHLDTVPPYIAPSVGIDRGGAAFRVEAGTNGAADGVEAGVSEEEDGVENESEIIRGRGTCDAKGQIFAMYEACKALEDRGLDGFGLLLLAGEETGSFGAKAFREQHPGAEWVVVGEPTDNCMASASKGTKAFEVAFEGKAFHSGYPQYGLSAVEMFNDFMNALRSIGFPYDEVLGDTTWNIGKLASDNPQNIISDKLTCRIYFRTTFESDEMVCNVMKNIAGPQAKLRFGKRRAQDGSDIVAKEVAPWQKTMSVKALGGDTPTRYEVLEGFPTKPVAFGSDAPQLTNFRRRILCGPGSILVAHRPEEYIDMKDIEAAIQNYVRIYETIVPSEV